MIASRRISRLIWVYATSPYAAAWGALCGEIADGIFHYKACCIVALSACLYDIPGRLFHFTWSLLQTAGHGDDSIRHAFSEDAHLAFIERFAFVTAREKCFLSTPGLRAERGDFDYTSIAAHWREVASFHATSWYYWWLKKKVIWDATRRHHDAIGSTFLWYLPEGFSKYKGYPAGILEKIYDIMAKESHDWLVGYTTKSY